MPNSYTTSLEMELGSEYDADLIRHKTDFITKWVDKNVEQEISRGNLLRKQKPTLSCSRKQCHTVTFDSQRVPSVTKLFRKRSIEITVPSSASSVRRKPSYRTPKKQSKKVCPLRIAELAAPPKRLCIATLNSKSEALPAFMVERLRQYVKGDQPLAKISDAVECFKVHKNEKNASTCFNERKNSKKSNSNDSKKQNICRSTGEAYAIRMLSAQLGYRVGQILAVPFELLLNDEQSRLSNEVAAELLKLLNDPMNNQTHFNTKVKKDDRNLIEASNKIALWINNILNDAALKLCEEELRAKKNNDMIKSYSVKNRLLIQLQNEGFTYLTKEEDLEEKEGPVLDILDNLLEDVLTGLMNNSTSNLNVNGSGSNDFGSKDFKNNISGSQDSGSNLEEIEFEEESSSKEDYATYLEEFPLRKNEEATSGVSSPTYSNDVKTHNFPTELELLSEESRIEELKEEDDPKSYFEIFNEEDVDDHSNIELLHDEEDRTDSDKSPDIIQEKVLLSNLEEQSSNEVSAKTIDSRGAIMNVMNELLYEETDEEDKDLKRKVKFSVQQLENGVISLDTVDSTKSINTDTKNYSHIHSLLTLQNITFAAPNKNLLSDADELWPADISEINLKPSSSVSKSITSLGKITETDETKVSIGSAAESDVAKEKSNIEQVEEGLIITELALHGGDDAMPESDENKESLLVEVIDSSIMIEDIDSSNKEPILIEVIESSNEEPILVEVIDSSNKEPILVEDIESSNKEPILIEVIDSSNEEPILVEVIDKSNKEPILVEDNDISKEEPMLVKVMDSINKEPILVEDIDSSNKEPILIEDIDSSNKELMLVDVINSFNKEPILVEVIDSSNKEPILVEVIDTSSSKEEPKVVEDIDSSNKEPKLVDVINSFNKEPILVEVIDSSDKEPILVEVIDTSSSKEEPKVVEDIDSSNKEPMLVEVIDSSFLTTTYSSKEISKASPNIKPYELKVDSNNSHGDESVSIKEIITDANQHSLKYHLKNEMKYQVNYQVNSKRKRNVDVKLSSEEGYENAGKGDYDVAGDDNGVVGSFQQNSVRTPATKFNYKIKECSIREWGKDLEHAYKNLEQWNTWLEQICKKVLDLKQHTGSQYLSALVADNIVPVQSTRVFLHTKNKELTAHERSVEISKWERLKKDIDREGILWRKLGQCDQIKLNKYNNIKNKRASNEYNKDPLLNKTDQILESLDEVDRLYALVQTMIATTEHRVKCNCKCPKKGSYKKTTKTPEICKMKMP